MKTIGLLGGMSWESSLGYYQKINQGIRQHLGGLHSAQIAMYSVDFAPIERLQHQGDWQGAAELLIQGARAVEAAGADFLLICTNTMHKVAPEIEASISIPLLHIVDALAAHLQSQNISTVGLLGTRFTMQDSFFRQRLQQQFGIQVLVPSEPDMEIVHRVIYEELCQGRIDEQSREKYLSIINQLSGQGAQGMVLGCTEIGLLLQQHHCAVPLFDTLDIHVDAAVQKALID
ncbi:aspartate/glutamate racemase family protein [Lacimicrobium alkaliphilum]|uniref:Aspartate racemase n=1 Tax=Lacimicrobium alkaliphilum TaxID=1526571 RepID=A0A0U3AVK6_9ALTE|nr:aspartate/glutamate racemase family protein [Lacimicrobium alkaliphilum]ALS96928.1 aspartate racemase [Lacimicrobium alkaliphilum]